jgi:protein-S-isoprenylcysteine O-methyltransferase Ste14
MKTTVQIFLPSIASVHGLLLDVADRAITLCLFGHFAITVYAQYVEDPDIDFLLMLLSEALPIIYIVLRPRTDTISRSPSDWICALLVLSSPLIITIAPVKPLVPEIICLLLVIAGLCLQIYAKIFLGLSFGVIAANRGVKTGGPYRYIRHPIYAGYTLTHIGLALAMPSLYNVLIYVCCFGLQLVRMDREEEMLSLDKDYRALVKTVRYRLVPGLY